MNKIRAIIIDDESLARDFIRELLKKHSSIQIIAEGNNGIEALNLVSEFKPDLLFLDIQMPELNGFDALKEMDAEILPLIIFTTAHDKYALKAFEASAIDYLLKPFDQERFDIAIQKTEKYLSNIDQSRGIVARIEMLSNYEKLIALTKRQTSYIERLLVREMKRIIPVKVDDVEIFEAEIDYVRLHLRNQGKSYLINNSITRLETLLNPKFFVRIHRSTIINIDSIAEMQPHPNGEFKIRMKNGMEVKLSRSFKDALRRIAGMAF